MVLFHAFRSCFLPLESAGASSSVVRSRWLRDLFESADKDSSGTLTVKEVLALMNELNVGVSKKILKNMFKVCLWSSMEGDTLPF